MKWLKIIGLVVVGLIAILALVPLFVSLDDYVPTIEKELSARIGEPVSIESLHASAFPAPSVRIDGITIGSAEDVQVGKVTLTPDLWSLLRSPKTIRSVEFEDVTVAQKAFGALAALTQGDRGAGNLRIESIRLRNAVVKLESARSFGPFDVEVRVGADGGQGDLTLTTRDDALKAHLKPDGKGYLIQIAARAWTPPMGPAIRFDELSVKGVVRNKDADLNEITAKLYGGTASGKAALAWDKGVSIKGNLVVQQVELSQAAALFVPKTRISGRLDAKPVFSAHAASADQLDEALRLESPFDVHNGVLHGFDLAAAAASLGKQTSSGETRFDALSGHLVRERRSYRFTNLNITSGVLSARGNVTISSSRALSGQLNTNVKALGRAVSLPLTVGGTLDSPMLLPNASALAGAAAGTAILGPGAGTAAGAELGKWVDGLFGKPAGRR